MANVTRYRASPPPPPPRRPARLRIFMPTLGLLLVMGGVAVVWAVLSWRAGQEMDAWLQREADLGRAWSCPDRGIAGFPFRIEVTCTDATFTGMSEGRALKGKVARVHSVAQIYNPGHVIVEVESPLVVEAAGGDRLEVDWLLGRASILGKPGAGLDRFSAELTEPRLTLTNARVGTITVTAGVADFHIRRTPNSPAEDGAYDVASRITRATIPPLDALIGSASPAEADFVTTITRAEPLAGRGLPTELERWRVAGGRMQVTKAMVSHGPRRLDASGTVGLDDARRPQGRLDVTVSGLDDLLARFGLSGRSSAIGGLIAGVLGGRPGGAQAAEAPAQGAPPGPKGVVLPLRMDGGRVFLGPIPVATLLPLF
jgi:hypothetical protein